MNKSLEKVYNVVVVLCILMALNIVVVGLYMRNINVFALIKNKLGRNSSEYKNLLK